MSVNFSSMTPIYPPYPPAPANDNRISLLLTCLAFAILLTGVVYLIYSRFWQERDVKPLSPKDSKDDLRPVFDKAVHPEEVVHLEEAVPDVEEADPLLSPKGELVLEGDEVEEPSSEEGVLDKLQTTEMRIEADLTNVLETEKRDHSYGGSFLRYEGVYAALKYLEYEGKDDWVDFCNQTFADYHEEKKGFQSYWELNISIDPAKRYVAWKLLVDEIENTPLCIQGAIHSASSIEKYSPGKQISLKILVSDHDKQQDLQKFLSLMAHHFSQAAISPDNRPLNSDAFKIKQRVDGIIACEGLPSYFSYQTDSYTVVDDSLWDQLTKGCPEFPDSKGQIVYEIDNLCRGMVKASYYATLGEKRVNPLELENPFANIKVQGVV